MLKSSPTSRSKQGEVVDLDDKSGEEGEEHFHSLDWKMRKREDEFDALPLFLTMVDAAIACGWVLHC